MSLTAINLAEAVKKQYIHKLKANIDAFSALVGIQGLAILLSFGGVNSSGMSGGSLTVEVNYYSADIVIAFTILWAFITAITTTSKINRAQDFTFVTNRLSSSLSNILFLATAGLAGSITAILAGNLLKTLVYLFINKNLYAMNNGNEGFLSALAVIFFYVLLAASIGYFFGSLTQISKLFVFLIPILIFGLLALSDGQTFIKDFIMIFIHERSVFLFGLKAILTAGLFFAAAAGLFQRMEVRR